MAIPEAQLVTWSHQGSIQGSSATYAIVKRALEAPNAEVFLQGSYGNDTNIYAESDVDVICLASTSDYGAYKGGVMAALVRSFGPDVSPGRRAIKIAARGNRRSADVVVAVPYESGLCFFDPGGHRFVSYPKQHAAACTAKHQATNEWFKPMVRVLKNMRRRMLDDGLIRRATAPSYFLEGLLYNVPDDKFGGSYVETFTAAINSLLAAPRQDFTLANGRGYLVGSDSWPSADCDTFLQAVVKLWDGWE